MLGTILIVVLILMLLGSFPGGPAPWAAGWGYGPSGLLGAVLLVVLVLYLLGGRI
jgi:hypothetical protein